MAEALVIRIKAAPPAVAIDAAANAKSDAASSAAGAQVAALEAAMVQAEWLLFDPSAARQSEVQTGLLSDAAGFAVGRKVIVIVPGTDVLLAEPVLPLKSGVKLLQVLPFALEEQLASDVEDMHFAVGKREGTPGTPVAAVAHDLMRRWQASLRGAGIHAEAIYAESGLLPVTTNGVTLMIDSTRVYVRRLNGPGAVLDVEPLIEAVQLALASGEEAREHVTIYLTDDVYERDRDLFEGLREFTESLQLKLLPNGPLQLFASAAVNGSAINLLQGPYATKTKLNISFQPWRYAAVLAGAFLALHFGLKTWQYFDLRNTEAKLDSQIMEVFQQSLPGAPVPDPSAARKQVEARLAALRGGGPTGGIMSTLGTLGEALAQAPGTNIEALSYRDETTDLRILAPSVDALDKIQHAAAERGIAAEIQSANPRDSKIEGRLQFKKSGA
jgi:general secretion pathway protein L